MSDFKVTYVARSDGRAEVEIGGRTEKNQPTPEQLDPTPNEKGVVDYYKKLDNEDSKVLDWRRKLAGMLAKETVKGEKDGATILSSLPDNYVLYEHLKYTVVLEDKDDDKTQTPSRSIVKGRNDRQDAYLYGHPLGRKKRFRSPADFFPHIFWLSWDEARDRGNCSCKICQKEEVSLKNAKLKTAKPEETEEDENEPKSAAAAAMEKTAKSKQRGSAAKPDDVAKPAFQPADVKSTGPGVSAPPSSAPMFPVNPRKRTLSHVSVDNTKQATRPAPTPAAHHVSPPVIPAHAPTGKIAAPDQLVPTRLPNPISSEQDIDIQSGQFLYRLGELVWYSDGPSWSLAVITKRDLQPVHPQSQDSPSQARYVVQPLSHPVHHHRPALISDELLLRPWLSFEIPQLKNGTLRKWSDVHFQKVNWQGVIKGDFGPGDPSVDGAILAAKMVDESYTLIEPLSNLSHAGPGETHYNGIYFRGEKIWVGEPVRVRVSKGTGIMVLHQIVEKRTAPGFAGLTSPSDTRENGVKFVGDIFSFVTVPVGAHVPEYAAHLPRRLAQDLAYRNEISRRTHQTVSYWKLMSRLARFGLGAFRGRWYASRTLLPIVRGRERFTVDEKTGNVGDAGIGMSERMKSFYGPGTDKVNPPIGVRENTRGKALGDAVPPGWEWQYGGAITEQPLPRSVPPQLDGAMDLN